MDFKIAMKGFVNFVEDLFLTNHKCIYCGREIPDTIKYGLCDGCYEKLEIFSGTLCSKCGEPVVEGNTICDECKEIKYEFDINHSFSSYSEVSARIVKNLKYNRKKYLARYLAYMMAEDREYCKGVDYITFVPISKARLKERGFNQAEEIAKEISILVNVPVIDAFDKIKENTHQAGLSRRDRIKNIIGTIEVKDDAKDLISRKNILVVDDVFTTGSTLSECAKVLKKSKSSSVKTLTFAKTRQNMIKSS